MTRPPHGPPGSTDSSYFDEERGRWIVKGPVVFPAGLPKLGGWPVWPTVAIPNPEPEEE